MEVVEMTLSTNQLSLEFSPSYIKDRFNCETLSVNVSNDFNKISKQPSQKKMKLEFPYSNQCKICLHFVQR